MFEINEMQKVPLDGIMDNVDEQDNWFHYVQVIQYRTLLWNCIFLFEFKMMVSIHVTKDEKIAENN